MRLGATAPQDPTLALQEVMETSDLGAEFSNAKSAVTLAIARIEASLECSRARRSMVVDSFLLVFASASVAPLMLELPITSVNIRDQLFGFILWLFLTLGGLAAVVWQHRR